MYLDQYITKLLEQHECVIIPELGAFIANERPSFISETDSKIYPPSRRLAFNPSLNFNDGLLINHIAFCLKISYTEATEQVRKSTESLKKQLSNREKILFVGIGELSVNSDDKIIFTPLSSLYFHPESFGFYQQEISPVERIAPELVSIEKEIKSTLELKDEIISPEKVNHKTSKSRKVLYYSLSAYIPVLLGLWAVLFFADPFGKESTNKNLAAISTEKSSAVTKIPENEVSTAKSSKMDVASLLPIEETTSVSYHIIGGSFKSRRNAAILQHEFENKNFESKIIRSANGQYRVTYSSFNNRAEAEQFLKQIRQSENSSAWILNE